MKIFLFILIALEQSRYLSPNMDVGLAMAYLLILFVVIYMAVFPRTLAMFFLLHHGKMLLLGKTFLPEMVNPPKRRDLLIVIGATLYNIYSRLWLPTCKPSGGT